MTRSGYLFCPQMKATGIGAALGGEGALDHSQHLPTGYQQVFLTLRVLGLNLVVKKKFRLWLTGLLRK